MNELQQADIDEFKARFRGDVLLPDDANYDETRQIWNGYDRPEARGDRSMQSPDDVVQAVNFAHKNN